MAKFLTTRGTSSEIENIINGAKKWLVLISPFLQVPEALFQTLRGADLRKVRITIVHGKRELSPDEKSQLARLDNLSLQFLGNLHAKCFFNEERMVITSMNLYDFSEQHNREMGVLITARDDKDVFKEAVEEAKLIVNLSEKTDSRTIKSRDYSYHKKQNGCCIRCGKAIPCDLEKPFCLGCFNVWVRYKDRYWGERFCHTCGKPAETSKAEPQCYLCYRKSLI